MRSFISLCLVILVSCHHVVTSPVPEAGQKFLGCWKVIHSKPDKFQEGLLLGTNNYWPAGTTLENRTEIENDRVYWRIEADTLTVTELNGNWGISTYKVNSATLRGTVSLTTHETDVMYDEDGEIRLNRC